MVDLGSGPPLILIPGVQGRWEWMRPTVDALAARGRVVTASLAGDPGSEGPVDPVDGFDSQVEQIDRIRARAGAERVALCGVSYGGYIALRYAATRPERVTALVIASTPGPGWRPNRRQRRYVRWPYLTAPLFAIGAPRRLGPEILAAHGAWPQALRFAGRHSLRVLAALPSPRRMSRRVEIARPIDFRSDCAAVRAPTLVVTGEPGLDRVVPVETTLEYVDAIPGARAVTLARTGHIGCVTRAEEFARIVMEFVDEHARQRETEPLRM